MRKISFYTLFPVCVFASGQVCAERQVLVQLSQLTGVTDYEIGGFVQEVNGASGYIHFPVSKLEFPSDMRVLGIGLVSQTDKTQWSVKVSLSVQEDTTTMKDSDWILAPDSLDVYSESKNDGEVKMFEWRYASKFKSSESFTKFLGVGLLRQEYHFQVHDGLQIEHIEFPDDPNSDDPNITLPPVRISPPNIRPLPGNTISYDLTMFIPYAYFRLESDSQSSRLAWYGEIAVSPFAKVTDQDQHLLRAKVSQGDYIGTAFIYEIGSTYFLYNNASLAVSYRRITLDTDGHQDARFRFNEVDNHRIQADNQSDHTLVSLSLSVPF